MYMCMLLHMKESHIVLTQGLSDPPFTHPQPTHDFWAYPPVKIILVYNHEFLEIVHHFVMISPMKATIYTILA